MTKKYDKEEEAVSRHQIEQDIRDRDDMLRDIEHTILESAQKVRMIRLQGGDDAAVAEEINWMRGQLQRWSNIRYYMQNKRAMLKRAK